MNTLAEFTMNWLAEKGITNVFTVAGGGIMYLLDALGKHPKLSYTTTYHEQAAATAAESYARMTHTPAVCLVTTGPGSTNAITGVAGAWYDSIPMIVISGQVRTQVIADYTKIRQIAPQEVNIIPMVQPITKYAVLVTNPDDIQYELEKAYHLATSGRPGPVWLTLPLNIQSATVDKKKLSSYAIPQTIQLIPKTVLHEISAALTTAKRPLVLLGNGIWLAQGEGLVESFVEHLQLPVVTPINGLDLIAENHPLFIGRMGPSGQRRGNFALQTCDLLLSIGASLNINSTGFDLDKFAPKAKKIVVNIDAAEIEKLSFPVAHTVVEDAKVFMEELLILQKGVKNHHDLRWILTLQRWKKQFPVILPQFYRNKRSVNSYVFFDVLSDAIIDKAPVVTGMGLDVVSFLQAFRVQKGQKAYVNKNFGQMGWCLPAAIGASVATNHGHVVLVTGDGSLQFNLHELQTIATYNLPISIFIFNNDGYKSIRDTQQNLFAGRLVGADPSSGVGNPDFKKLAAGFRIPFHRITNNRQLSRTLPKILATKGPVICEILIDPNQERVPRPGTFTNQKGVLQSLPIEDLNPPIPRREFEEIMHFFDD